MNSGAVGGAAVLGGAVGGLAAAAIVIAAAKAHPTEYVIDMTDGTIIHPKRSKVEPQSGGPTCELVLYRNLKKESSSEVSVVVNGAIEHSLAPGEIVRITLFLGEEEAKVCIKESAASCVVLALSVNGVFYVQAADNGAEEASLESVSDTDGEYYTYKLEKAAKKKEKQ